MKRLDAANDNDAGKQIARTRQIWQPRLGRDLTDDDAHQIMHNVTGFFGLLAEWSRAETLVAANDVDSGYLVSIANPEGSGRSATVQLVHCDARE